MNSLSYSTVQLSDVIDVSASSITFIQTKTCLRGFHISVSFRNASQQIFIDVIKFHVGESSLVKMSQNTQQGVDLSNVRERNWYVWMVLFFFVIWND